MAGMFQESGIEAVVKNLNGFLADVGKMDSAIQGIGSNTRGITDWNDKITSVTANVAKVVGAAAVGATAAFGAFVVDATKKSADLESSLSGIAAVLNKGTEAIGPLKDLILDLGIDPALKVSATEAAQAVELLARNGLDMTQIMDGAARSTVLLANATGADFGVAADIATDAMAIFNIEAKDMNQAVNGITGVTTSSKFSIDDYRLALAQAGGVAGATGVSFDDFNATIAGIAPLFASGSDAGTSFKTFLQRLIPASEPAADAMKDLGLFTGLTKKEFESAQEKILKYQDQLSKLDPTSKKYAERAAELDEKIQVLKNSLVAGSNAFFDANGNMKDMDQIAGILQDALSGLSEEKKNDALATIFGTDAMRAAVGVANLGTEGYQKLGAQIAEIDAGNQAKTRMDNLSGSLEILNGIVETLRIRIGDKFNPVFRDLVDRVSNFLSANADRIVDFFGKLADMVQTAIDKFVPLVQSWLPKLEEWVNNGSTSLGGMIDKVVETVGGIGDFIDKIIAVVTPVKDWITENYTLEDILNGILAVITVSLIPAITSLVTTITPVIALFTTVAELSSHMTDGQKQFALAIGVAVFALPPLISAITTVTGAISAVIGIGSSLVGIITGGSGIVAALGAILNPVGLVVAAVAGLGIAWATDFGGIRTATIDTLDKAGTAIGTWSSNAVSKFQETQGKIGVTLAAWSENIGTTLANISSNTGTTLATWSSNTGTAFANMSRATGQTLATWASSVGTTVGTISSNTNTALASWSSNIGATFTTMSNTTGQTLSTWASNVGQKFTTVRNNAQNTFSGMSSSIQSSASNLASQALTALRGLETEGVPIFTKLKDNATSKAGEMLTSVKDRLSRLVSEGLALFNVQKWIDAGADVIGGIMTGLARAATAPLRWIENFAGGLIRTFTSILKIASPSQVFDEAGVNIMEGLEGGLETRSAGVLTFMGDFSRSLVATAEEAQRLADANFKALTDSALKAYDGASVILGDLSRLSTEIDQEAIAAQNAAHAAYVAAGQQTPTQSESAKYYGTGRVAELISQITQIVDTSFRQVGDTGVQSLGVNLDQFTSAGQTNNAIAALRLLAGTIQQNAQNAPDVVDRNRLQSLYNDVTNRLIPVLQSTANQFQAQEDAAKQAAAAEAQAAAAAAQAAAAAAAAEAAQRAAELKAAQQATTSFLGTALQPVIDQIKLLAQQGANLFFTDQQISGFDAATKETFDAVDQRLESTISYMLGRIQPELGNLGSTSSINNIRDFVQSVIDEIAIGVGGQSSLQWYGSNTLESDRQISGLSGLYGLLTSALPVLSGTTTSVDTTVNVGNVNNGMDTAALQALIEQAVAAALP